jgi:nicotinamide-nucleotide amidase
MNAVILSIGDELILGQTVDSNSAWLSAQLTRLGADVIEHITVGDDLPRIVAAICRAATMAQILVATGGLGPTDDDLTRQALADVMDQELVEDPQSLAQIQAFFDRIAKPMAPPNRRQALLPKGAKPIPNLQGTAPGIEATLSREATGQTAAFFLPGVPSEMNAMWHAVVRDRIARLCRRQNAARVMLSRTLHSVGLGESNVAQALGDLMARGREPLVNTTAHAANVDIRINAWATDEHTAKAAILPVEQEILRRLGNAIYGADDETLPAAVGKRLRQRRQSLAVAESCTGGLLGAAITEVPGASDYFLGGWQVYANQAKIRQLGVDPDTLQREGAVSEPTARQLAAHARQKSGADWAIAITGIAGPAGGAPEKPVGLVFIALAGPDVDIAQRYLFQTDRQGIRQRSVSLALMLLWDTLAHQPE